MSGPIRAVLLDAAGTLIRTREPVGESYARMARAHGVDLPAWRVEDGFRRVHASAPPMAFPGEPAARVRELEREWWRSRVRETFRATDQTARFRDFDGYFEALFAHFAAPSAWVCMPGASEALGRLRVAGLRLAVASNFDHRLGPILEALDLARFFEIVWGPAQAGAAKPERLFFASLLARLGVDADAAVHVGDDPEEDVVAAKAAGLHAVALAPPATLPDLPERIRALQGGQ